MPDCVVKQYLTEVYTLFPEYQDESHEASVPYVTKLTYKFEEESYPRCFAEILSIWKFYSFDSFCKYYDSLNLAGVLYPYETLEFPSVKELIMAKITQCGVIDWRKEFNESRIDIKWRDLDLAQDVCAHIFNRSLIDNDNLKVHATIVALDDTLVTDGDDSICFSMQCQRCSLKVQKSLKDIHAWLSENRIPQRKFKYCDKHGENGKGGWYLSDGTHTALLDCSCKHAQEILHKAIGDNSIDKDNDLWYYDAEFNKVLYFEYQNDNPQNEYHGYHINQGEKGYDKVNFSLLRQIQDDIPDHIDK